MNKTSIKLIDSLTSPLALIVGVTGILITFVAWYCLTYTHHFSLASPLEKALPWVILVLGISLAILFAVLVRLMELGHQNSRSLSLVNRDFEKEMVRRTHSEESKQKLEKALLQGQKLQAIGTLAGGIAHDFNNLLYAIIGYVEISREDVEKDSLVFKNLGKALEASQRGRELISRILTFSRRQKHDFKPLKIRATIESVLSLLRPTIPSSVTIIFQTMKLDCSILADQTQLHQVIVNIINNAVDAMDGEGIITLKLHHLNADDASLKQFHNKPPCDYCKIDISDTGHGMDATTLARIFEPFYTTKEVGKGTGLGLATVHAIIKEHNGEVLVDSHLGHGTTITLLLPECKEDTNGKNIIS